MSIVQDNIDSSGQTDDSESQLNLKLFDGTYNPIRMSSDDEDVISSDSNPNEEHNSKQNENIPVNSQEIVKKFQEFASRKMGFAIDEGLLVYAPPTIRPPIEKIIKNIKKWSKRNPTDETMVALNILVKRVNEFLELQQKRDEPEYDSQCRNLLTLIYNNTVEAQRLARSLKDSAELLSLE